MLTITNTSVTREHVWTAFRRTADVRLRERYHAILLLMGWQKLPRGGSVALPRRGDHSRLGSRAQ